jgi:hypothetical protein
MTDIDGEAHDELAIGLRHLGKSAYWQAVAAVALAFEAMQIDRVSLRPSGGTDDPQIHRGGGIGLVYTDLQLGGLGAVREHRAERHCRN